MLGGQPQSHQKSAAVTVAPFLMSIVDDSESYGDDKLGLTCDAAVVVCALQVKTPPGS